MHIISDNIGAWLAATIVAFMTIFSDRLLERIRFRLNRADIRAKYFEELAVGLSTYLFFAEILYERYQRGWATDPEDLNGIGGEINGAATTLRTKEYVYRSWVRRYWDDAVLRQFGDVMSAMKSVEDAVHSLLNDEGDDDEKATLLGRELDKLRAKAEKWMQQVS